MVIASLKTHKSKTDLPPLIRISEDERKENSQRLITAYSGSLTRNNSLIRLAKYFIKPLIKDEQEQEEIISKYSLNLINQSAESYDYFISASEDLSKNQNFITWMKICLRNLSLDYLRAKMRNKSKTFTEISLESLDKLDFNISGRDSNPLEIACANEESQIKQEFIKDEFDKYKPDNPLKKKILELYFFDDLSYTEIAEKVGVPLGTVKSRLFYAKKDFIKSSKLAALLN